MRDIIQLIKSKLRIFLSPLNEVFFCEFVLLANYTFQILMGIKKIKYIYEELAFMKWNFDKGSFCEESPFSKLNFVEWL